MTFQTVSLVLFFVLGLQDPTAFFLDCGLDTANQIS